MPTVRFPTRDRPDLIVLVQQKERAVTFPVRELGNRLVTEGLFALAAVILTVCVLWYFVVRKLGGFSRTRVQNLGDRPTTRSLHSMDTLTAPAPNKGT